MAACVQPAGSTDEAGPVTPIDALGLPDPVVLVLAEGETDAAINNARGHLFERFVARLLQIYGYNKPTQQHRNITRDGIELDVSATHGMTGHSAIAECKAYISPVTAAMLGSFHSKLVTTRYASPHTQGFFVALPRLTSNGQEQADLIAANDSSFRVLAADNVVELLKSSQTIVECPTPGLLTSDPAVVVTEHGVHAACLDLDPVTRKPSRTLVWAPHGPVPTPVLESLSKSPYTQTAPVFDARETHPIGTSAPQVLPDPDPVIVTVAGSQSDFEYQLPASPRFFVGRKQLVESLGQALDTHAAVVVLNAQSGWGKSSAALRLQELTIDRGGYALIVDSRTASYRRFVTDALSRAAQEAECKGVLALPSDASWASLPSALRTLRDAIWHGGPLVVFFDQFENIFRDESLTREFRDLALSARDLADRLLVGFAWKTDLVGWTENHPYQLRDEIRGNATVLTLGPLGPAEVDTLLRRLEKALGQALARDLRTRLREYSAGLPWLFKKLAGHLLREVEGGATQEQLASEALNVQNLFDADLAELGPTEQEALKHIARHAPISISEVMERVNGPVVETLVHRRLVVQVGERLDTYWDIFRDYLNNGRIPIEDSYILRQSPTSVARLLREVLLDQGNSRVPDLANRMGTSEPGVFNLSRELRLLGATSYEPLRVRILPDIWNADDREQEIRRRVAGSLRRHRSYSAFLALADRTGGVSLPTYARALQSLFPAVDVTDSTWVGYARVHLLWFEYAGLALGRGAQWHPAPEGSPGTGELLGGRVIRRVKGGWPHDPAGPAIRLLRDIAASPAIPHLTAPRSAARSLLILGAIGVNSPERDGDYHLTDPSLVVDGEVVPDKLRALMKAVAGVSEGIAVLEEDPRARPEVVGAAVKAALTADWALATTRGVGKHLRSWASHAGLNVLQVSRISRQHADQDGTLFDVGD